MTDERLSTNALAAIIDHAVLAPDATDQDVRRACRIAARACVASVCVRPCDVAMARQIVSGAPLAIATVVGFPHGSQTAAVKVAEAGQAVADGADELDMVINVGRLRSGDAEYVADEIAAIVESAGGRVVKVICECCYLDREQMAQVCAAAVAGGADFVKTSTGFGAAGATVEDVRFLRSQVGQAFGVKAAGGIRTLADAAAMIRAGANRIGTSRTEQILAECTY